MKWIFDHIVQAVQYPSVCSVWVRFRVCISVLLGLVLGSVGLRFRVRVSFYRVMLC